MDLQQPDLHSYYRHTGFDYRAIWNRRRRDFAVHFGYYDEQARHHAAALDNMNRVLADLAGIGPGEEVLDAGCGLGSACFWLAEHRQARVTGINLVAGQIAACRKMAARKKVPGVQFIEADFCQMPFPEASFDVVWACESVCHTPDKARFYREARRILKPGGRLVMAEYLRRARPAPPEHEHLLAAWLRPWAIPDLDTATEHQAHAAAAGFEKMEIRNVTPNVRVSLRNLHEMASRWLPLGKLLNRVGWVNNVRLGNALASVKQYEALQAGAWEYGMLRAIK